MSDTAVATQPAVADPAQDRLKQIAERVRQAGPMVNTFTPLAFICHTARHSPVAVSTLGLKLEGKKIVPMAAVPFGDEQEDYEALAAGSASLAKHRAARAKAWGFTAQDVDDIELLLVGKSTKTKAFVATTEWIRAYRKL